MFRRNEKDERSVMMKKYLPYILPLIVILLSSCRSNRIYFEEKGVLFNRNYTLLYQSPRRLTALIDAEMETLNNSLNAYNPSSIVAKINRNEPTDVDEHFAAVVEKAKIISKVTGGIFDITCFPLVLLWSGAYENTEIIPTLAVDSIRRFVGYRKIHFEGNRLIKDDPRMQITLTALAKGYVADHLAKLLEENKVRNYKIDIGGVIVTSGIDTEGNPWHITIRKPETMDERTFNIEQVIRLKKKGGIATAGNFHSYYIKEGKKHAHTINPLTGYPAEQNILSCTIIADDSMTSDGLSVAFTALNDREAARIGDSLPGVEYFLIYTDEDGNHKIKSSEGMKEYLV
ncbi:MAG: FAD:protein FMN transferase, partial [Tannerellaceae bacterium]|nr:FAD:protein FMN transferase [Tannerellaceae bacterium]